LPDVHKKQHRSEQEAQAELREVTWRVPDSEHITHGLGVLYLVTHKVTDFEQMRR